MSKNKKEEKKPLINTLLPGAVGGAVGTVATMPIDTTKDTIKQFANEAAKLKQQVKASPKLHRALAPQIRQAENISRNLPSAVRYINKTQGMKGFFRGMGASLIKIVPAMAITFGAGDMVRRQLEKKSDYDLERRLFDAIPHPGRAIFDKALLGRIGDHNVSGEEKDIAKHVPYKKKHQYAGSRILTNPIATGAGVAAGAVLVHKYRAPVLRKLFSTYKRFENKKAPAAKVMRSIMAPYLKDPDTGNMVKSVKRINQFAIKSPKEVTKSVVMSATATAGATALGRYLHPRALKSEAIMKKEQYHQRNPSEYIRVKLRDDVELKRGKGIIKSGENLMSRKAENILEKIALSPELLQRAGIKAFDKSEALLNAGNKAKALKKFKQGTDLLATSHDRFTKRLKSQFAAMRRSHND